MLHVIKTMELSLFELTPMMIMQLILIIYEVIQILNDKLTVYCKDLWNWFDMIGFVVFFYFVKKIEQMSHIDTN